MISHNHKCIFVHIPKTGGQSIELVFLKDLGLNWKARLPLLMGPNPNRKIGPPRLAHLKASEYVRYRYLSQELYEQYFKFAFVRNPWDRVTSLFRYLGYSKKVSFNIFVTKVLVPRLWKSQYWFVGPQYEYIYDDKGNLNVDYVGRLEHLESHFRHVEQRLGLSMGVSHANKSSGKTTSSTNHPKVFQEYYDAEMQEIVADLYRKDIELFGYAFESESEAKPIFRC
jgi:hypothetical protein